jgi:hypothetical protein
MAVPNVGELIATTLFYQSDQIADNVSDNSALLFKMRESGRIKPVDGGYEIREPLDYQENGTFKRYYGWETLNVNPSETIDAAKFAPKQAAVAIAVSGLEEAQNAGKEQLFDLVEARIENAKRTLRNNINGDLYSDGTGDGGKQIGGLQHLVSATPTSGTVGGINRATWSFWQNQLYRAVTDGGVAISSANVLTYFNKLKLRCTRNTDRPKIAFCDDTIYEAFLSALQARQIITESKMAEAGFDAIRVGGVDIVHDGGVGGACPSASLFLINTDYMKFRPYKNRNMVPLNPDRFAVNQDGYVKLIGFMGNLTMSNAQLQGVLTNT